MLGSILGQPMFTIPVAPDDPAGPRPQSAAVSNRITQRYGNQVKDAEFKRLDRLKPLSKKVTPLPPDVLTTARQVKKQMDGLMQKAGIGGNTDWEKLTRTDGFRLKMEYMHDHGRTGQFVEHYGAEGQYEGEFLNSMRHGRGKHELRGEVYDGEWKWDFRHGAGESISKDGGQIKGSWQNGKPHGFVTMTNASGTVTWEGEFCNGKRHGLGRQLFESGDIYDGCWQDGRLHDRGVYHFTNGDKLYGVWSCGVYDGVGVLHYSNGSISRRVYRKGVLLSVQDYEHSSQRFGKNVTRESMQTHSQREHFPKDVFLMTST